MQSFWKAIRFPALLAVAVLGCAQTVDKPASVRGVVTDTVTGAPITRVHVTLIGNSNGTQLAYGAMTTPDGRFSIDGIAPAQYTFTAERVGYVDTSRAAGSTSISLQADEKKTDVTLKLTQTGAITGRVTDSDGQPVEGAAVTVDGGGGMTVSQTDDQGQYRIGGLSPGRYRVRAAPANRVMAQGREIRTDGSEETYSTTTYFPGTLDTKTATRVRVGPGADASGVDIRLARSSLLHISGRVVGGSENAQITSVVASSGLGMNSAAIVQKDGTFEIWRIDPGKYTVTANANGRGSPGLRSAPVEVEVTSSSVEGLELRMAAAADLPGHLEFDDDQAKQMPQSPPPSQNSQTPPPPVATQRRIAINQIVGLNQSGGSATVEQDNTFRIKNISPGRYRVTVTPGSVYVKSIRFGASIIDGSVLDLSGGVAGGDLSVLLSSATGTISGTIKDDDPLGTRIVLAPAEGGVRNRFATAAADGSWTIDSLPPGSYKLVAVPASEANAVMQRGGLDDYEDAFEPVEVHPGDKLTKDLKRATPR